MIKLRQAASGPELVGDANGDVPLWDATQRLWTTGTPSAPAVTGYDFTFASYADLESQFPGIGGVHTMPDAGSYLFAGPITLPAGEQLVFSNSVALWAANGALISGNIAGSMLVTEASAVLNNLTLVNANADASSVTWELASAADDSIAYNLTSSGPGSGPLLGGGTNKFFGGRIVHSTTALELGGLRCELYGTNLSGDNCLLLNVGTLESLKMVGGQMTNATLAIAFFAGVPNVSLHGVEANSNTTWLLGNASIGSCLISNCYVANGTNGISWPAVDMAPNGLLIVASLFDVATPFNGFAATDALVNVKACATTGALLAETAIVP